MRTHLADGCSPEQIAGRFQRAYPDDMGKQQSAETLYAGLYVLPRGTLVERTTRLVIQARMEGMDAWSAREGFTKKLWHVPAPLRKMLTYDRGKEMAEHARLAEQHVA